MTNIRYKEYLKRTVADKYKVTEELPPPEYQPDPSVPPPPYVDCGYNGWILIKTHPFIFSHSPKAGAIAREKKRD